MWDNVTPVLRNSLVGAFVVRLKKLCILSCPKCAQWRFWSDCTHVQAAQNLRWVHISDVTDHLQIPDKLVVLLSAGIEYHIYQREKSYHICPKMWKKFILRMLMCFILSILWANSAGNKLMIFSYFPQKTGFDIPCKLSHGDNFVSVGDNKHGIWYSVDSMHELSKPVFMPQTSNNLCVWGGGGGGGILLLGCSSVRSVLLSIRPSVHHAFWCIA